MKKLFWVCTFVAVAGFAAFYFLRPTKPKEFAIGSAEWKYYTAENERAREVSFESLKWHNSEAVELRAPASKNKNR